MYRLEHLLSIHNNLGEGPLWHTDEECLYWVNITEKQIHRLHPADGQHDIFDVGVQVGVMGRRTAGGFVLATDRGFAFWQPGRSASLDFFAYPEADVVDSRFNDGAIDRCGRFWAGTLNERRTPTSRLYRLDADLSIHSMVNGLTTPNGIGWSPDGMIMYYTDSHRRTIYASDFDPLSGKLSHTRPLVQTPEGEGSPDGMAVDEDGYLWSARWNGWKIVRYTPAGEVDREVRLPVQCPSSCAFGGKNLDELYITSARTALDDEQRRAQPLSGDLFRYYPGVRGLEPVQFAG